MKRGARAASVGAALACLGLAALPARADAQLVRRPGCTSIDCPDSLFRLELERMTLTEGPLANDRDAGDLRTLRRRIRNELRDRPEDPALWLALSEAEMGLADAMPALSAATRALAAGADSALALRAQGVARMRVSGGEADGATLYLAGVGRMTRASAPRFLADLVPILTPNELDWWRSSGIETLRTWTRDYWEHRAALAGVSLEERLAEHIRRTAVAVRMFAPPGTGSGAAGGDDLLRRPEYRILPYDDRGLVYIRRGRPLDELRVASDIFSELPTSTWLYAGVDGTIDAFHFARSLASGSGYRVVVAPACDLNYAGSGRAVEGVRVADGWVLSQAGLEASATRAAVSCFSGDPLTQRANARMNSLAMRQQAMRAMAEESPRAPFREAIPAFFDFFMFRGADGGTEIVTPVVVPVGDSDGQAVDVLVTFADEGGGVARREATSTSVRTAVTRTIVSGGEGWGVAYLRTPVRPTDRAAFRVVVRDPDAADAGGMWGGTIPVRSFEGAGPRMSDVVVTGSGPSTWSRGVTRLFLLPARSFHPGAPVALFYELYDMQAGSTYRTELTLRPLEETLGARVWRALTGSGQVRVRFDSTVPDDAGSVMQELRSLRLPVEEGRYSLTVRVTGASGAAAESTREIVISEDAALPSVADDPAAFDQPEPGEED